MVFDMLFSQGKDLRPEPLFFKRINIAEQVINKIFVFNKQNGFKKGEYNFTGKEFNLDKLSSFYEEDIKKYMTSINNDMQYEKQFPLIRCK